MRLFGDHDFALNQSTDLLFAKSELGKNFAGVLADARGLPAQREIVLAHLDRQPRQFCALAVLERDVEHAPASIELRIVEQVAGFGDRRKRNIDAVEQFGKRGEPMLATISATSGRSTGRARTRSSLVL